MTSNWGALLKLDKIDYYICSVIDNAMLHDICKSDISPRLWMLTDNVKNKIPQSSKNYINLFKYMNSLCPLGNKHIKSKEIRGNIDLPTTGIQMIYLASFMDVSSVNIYGINLYTKKDKHGNYKNIGSTSKENPYIMLDKPHSIETDIEFIIAAFNNFICNKVILLLEDGPLSDIYGYMKNNMVPDNIIKKIVSKYG